MFLLYIIADCHVYICDFRREQAWERWAGKKDNGVLMEKETLLCHLRRAAGAETIPKYNEAVNALKSLTLWKENPKLRNWLNNIWLRICKVMCLVEWLFGTFSNSSKISNNIAISALLIIN